MVLPSNVVPPNAGWVAREIQSLWARIRELTASVATSLSPQVQFLLDQTVTATVLDLDSYLHTSGNASVWKPFDGDLDPQVSVVTSSTGRLDISVCGLLSAEVRDAYRAETYLSFDVLDAASSEVIGPSFVEAAMTGVISKDLARTPEIASSATSSPIPVTLAPKTAYTIRARRGYRYEQGLGSSPYMAGAWWNPSLTVTKIGI